MRQYIILLTLFLLVTSLVILRIMTPIASISSAHSITPTLSTTPAWKSLTTFTGTGNQHTATFTVLRQWRLSWRCQGYDDGITGSFGAVPHEAHGLLGIVARGPCAAHAVSTGYIDERGAGSYSLTVYAAGNWWTATVEIPAGSPVNMEIL